MTDGVRLHKLLAGSGVASLRTSERLIAEGRVSVNGNVVTAPGAVATPGDEICVDGRPVAATVRRRYFMLNKPRGVLSTARDERNRRTVLDLVGAKERLFPVGRLDRYSEGLMLLTNDGELAERMMHPRYRVHKEYRADVAGRFTEEHLARLRAGVTLEDGPSRPLSAEVLQTSSRQSTLRIVMGEGRNRQVRRTLEKLGFRVVRLVRVGLGPLRLDSLAAGASLELSAEEAARLRNAVGLDNGEERS